jgi:hypothetical protein
MPKLTKKNWIITQSQPSPLRLLTAFLAFKMVEFKSLRHIPLYVPSFLSEQNVQPLETSLFHDPNYTIDSPVILPHIAHLIFVTSKIFHCAMCFQTSVNYVTTVVISNICKNCVVIIFLIY